MALHSLLLGRGETPQHQGAGKRASKVPSDCRCQLVAVLSSGLSGCNADVRSRHSWKGLWENSSLLFSYLFLEIDFESNGRARKEAFVVMWTESGASAGTNRCLQLGRGSSPSSSSESWLVLPSCTLTELLCPCNPSRSAARAARLLDGAFCSLLSCKPCAAGFIESLGLENH